ncbi:phage tail protein [Xanthomonas rydalmerensis]|uniref:Tail fiber protein n=1 Tax=Xanthomonas rydalmerensis TaxID=3046274 RepID=A0ABZ0JL24_9XANT|nr:tail fiber protein [Xanthomonas sp. DM-2023]WOS40495.1 tail fiber protein [Xanthomonas sp. DM-2023]WOS44679.1 tail fiber protein [Xanthomonas sp. DM-2023]WOS48859.1 tail fiber protein [Xanthomonas sp. DM-2023]WOS53039.1 tail fiber protein [Xanthomonas sp. DM-2023]WOS57223.1 tail fiber protein [Xanthomonas sp. DM-2023]
MSNSFIGEVRAFPYNFAPEGWLDCMGQLVSVQQYQMLFSLLSNFYGGDGRATFGLPDLRGRAVVGRGQGTGLSNYALAQQDGTDSVALGSVAQLPVHTHTITSKFTGILAAPTSFSSTPSPVAYVSRLINPVEPITTYAQYKMPPATVPLAPMSPATLLPFPASATPAQAHENRQPFTTMRYCICATDGIYPERQD